MPSNHLILCRFLLLPPSILPSIRVSSNESVLHIRWPKYWCFCFSVSPFNEHPGLISFRMDWLDLLAVQGTLKSLLQHHHSKASIFQCSAFFMVQLSHLYMTIGKTIVLTSGLPFPFPGVLPNPGIKPRSPALQADSLPTEPQKKCKNTGVGSLSLLQQIFLTQESNQGLLHCRRILYQLS